ncbi:galactose mutarotase [Pseudoalteromonas shioyasakiensis]|uniref:aldose epimerase family protein n=1 Tax=Pseudoalteromonas shioyasakiensis TaxID=1190813 RepID=UPI0021182F4F|nr:aldose epimerase family protein [Pseudoalteromonas shioyasakiensis]MCQ8876576.1 galactose mutarotase [Pseudoalteromonas shioyasakiensis]
MAVQTITLTQANGLRVTLSSFGAAIQSIEAPNGEHLALSYQQQQDWLTNPAYLGTTVGRVANRIANSQFLDEFSTVKLTNNEGQHHLHGGNKGLSHVNWQIVDVDHINNRAVFSYISIDGEEGYRGNVEFTVIYQLTDNKLTIDMQGIASQLTPISITNHIYWNLGSKQQLDITDHHIQLPARLRLLKDSENIPTGEFANVYSTVYDFAHSKQLDKQLPDTGFDDYYLLDPAGEGKLKHHGTIAHIKSGYQVAVYSTAPGSQFYTGYYLPSDYNHINGKAMGPYAGLCIEPHELPNAVNHHHFLSSMYGPERPYQHQIEFHIQLPTQ